MIHWGYGIWCASEAPGLVFFTIENHLVQSGYFHYILLFCSTSLLLLLLLLFCFFPLVTVHQFIGRHSMEIILLLDSQAVRF